MCNIAAIGAFIIAAQVAFGSAIGFVVGAGALNANFWTAGGSPFLMIAALAAVAIALTSLALAARSAANCAATCPGPTAILLARIGALSTALVALSATMAVIVPLSSIPWAASLAIASVLAAFALAGILNFALTTDVAALSACIAATPPTPLVTIVTTVLGVLLLIGATGVVIVTIVGGFLPLFPLPPPI